MLNEVAFSNVADILLTVAVLTFVFILPVVWLGMQLLERAEKEQVGKSAHQKDGEEGKVCNG